MIRKWLPLVLIPLLIGCNLRGGPRKPGLLHTHTHLCAAYGDLYEANHPDLLYLEGWQVPPTEMGLYFFLNHHSGRKVSVKEVYFLRTENRRSWRDVFLRTGVDIHLLYLDLPGGEKLAPPYGRAYAMRTKPTSEVDLTDADVSSLWKMRVLVGYYGYTAAEVAAMGEMNGDVFYGRTAAVHATRAKGAAARDEAGKPGRPHPDDLAPAAEEKKPDAPPGKGKP